MNDNLLEVTKKEIHYWPSCPCSACQHEREQRTSTFPANSHIKRLSAEAAFILRLIPTRHPLGSLARSLMQHN